MITKEQLQTVGLSVARMLPPNNSFILIVGDRINGTTRSVSNLTDGEIIKSILADCAKDVRPT